MKVKFTTTLKYRSGRGNTFTAGSVIDLDTIQDEAVREEIVEDAKHGRGVELLPAPPLPLKEKPAVKEPKEVEAEAKAENAEEEATEPKPTKKTTESSSKGKKLKKTK